MRTFGACWGGANAPRAPPPPWLRAWTHIVIVFYLGREEYQDRPVTMVTMGVNFGRVFLGKSKSGFPNPKTGFAFFLGKSNTGL